MIQPGQLSPFKRFCVTIGELPTSYKESLTYYEMLEWFCNYLEKTVIPAVNNNAEALEELQNAFTTLKGYVDHYFENLDVQEEINNKLDVMATDGTLEAIINQELFNDLQTQITTNTNNISDNTSDIATAQADILTNTNAIGDISELETSTKTDTVTAINEVLNLLNLSTSEDLTFSITEGSGTIGTQTMKVIKNNSGSICKIYGTINITNPTGTTIKLKATSSLRPTSNFNITNLGIDEYRGEATQTAGIQDSPITIKTNGDIEINVINNSSIILHNIRFFPSLVFVKNFGD